MSKERIESIDVKQLANDVIKYGILDTKESKELTSLIMDVRKPTHGYCSDMTSGYEWPNNSISKYHKS